MREPRPVGDSTLDRELQELLSVNPSADFVARVHMAVSQQEIGRTFGRAWFAGSLVAAAAATVLVIWVSMHGENVNTDAEPRIAATGRDVLLTGSATRAPTQPVQHARSMSSPRATRTSPAEVIVMVWHEDARGLDELIRDIAEQRFAVAGEGATLLQDASFDSTAELAPIVFEPIDLRPIERAFQ